MSYIEEGKKAWEEHFLKTSLLYPDENVVRFLAKAKHLYPSGTMLDWGCGLGRHTVLGLDMGFDVAASDYVPYCLEETRKKVNELNVEQKVSYYNSMGCEIEGFSNESDEVIVAWGVVFYNDKAGMEKMLSNCYKYMKSGGMMLCNFRTEKDHIYESQKPNENNMYVLGSNGAQMSILPLDELKIIITEAGFVIDEINLYEFTTDNCKNRNSWWNIIVKKSYGEAEGTCNVS